MSRCYALDVKIAPHPIERQMRQRLHHEAQRAQEIKERLEVLAPAYNEVLDLRTEYSTRKARAETLLAIIGDHDLQTNDPAHRLRFQLPLWQAMKEYLQHVPEARIREMEEFFLHVGYDQGNRQAMESALKRHPKEFHVRRNKREKYLCLADTRHRKP